MPPISLRLLMLESPARLGERSPRAAFFTTFAWWTRTRKNAILPPSRCEIAAESSCQETLSRQAPRLRGVC